MQANSFHDIHALKADEHVLRVAGKNVASQSEAASKGLRPLVGLNRNDVGVGVEPRHWRKRRAREKSV